jgi:membrane-associated protease RseP (regulator of RpoE activity)
LLLLLATIATTFVTGYISFTGTGINPFVSGAVFSAAILTVLGIHEMGHKLTANKKKIDATAPYFIPGLPPLGTMGAVIMQKSLPPNRDALFDIGVNGPLAGFIVALVFSAVGLTLLVPTTVEPGTGLQLMPLSWVYVLFPGLYGLGLIQPSTSGYALNPIAWAGWAGMVVTTLNLLPAAMLDGGHVARSSTSSDKQRLILTFVSVAILLLTGTDFIFMAVLIVFMSMFKHPGPLDDVSSLSTNRKLLIAVIVAVFILAFPIRV